VHDLGNTNNRVVTIGSLSNSVLYFRVANLGSSHMPPLATFLVNTQAVDLLAAWITTPPSINLMKATTTINGNLQFMLDGPEGWTNVVEAAADLTTPFWLVIGTNVFDVTGTTTFTDTDATNYPSRFYRAFKP